MRALPWVMAGLAFAGSARAQTLPDEAPPPTPRRRGVVVESSLGVMGFAGRFRRVAPPGAWLGVSAGYEPLRWLLVFGYGELALLDTSVVHGPTKLRAFPLVGLGGGVRAKVHASDRVALFVQGTAGVLEADVPRNVLANLGFADGERFRPAFGARAGVEWYQADPHLALALHAGARLFTGLAATAGSDTPLGWESALALRYAF